MKRILNIFFFISMIAVVAVSCKKEENKVYLETGTAPVLSANASGTIPLSFANKDNEAAKLSWTNPNYQLTSGLSSQDVYYKVEIDTTNAAGTSNADFSNPNKQVLSLSKENEVSLTQGVLNDYLLNQLQLVPAMMHYLQIRVTASLNYSAVPLVSNVLKFTVTPYAIPPKVDPPASGKLFIVGSATPGDWTNPVPVPSQEFTKISNTLFELTVNITAGGSYLFLPVNGDWSAKYGAIGSNNTNNVNGDDFKAGGGDMLAPSTGGTYKIQVDFQRGKFTLTKL